MLVEVVMCMAGAGPAASEKDRVARGWKLLMQSRGVPSDVKKSGYSQFCPVVDIADENFEKCTLLWNTIDRSSALTSPTLRYANKEKCGENDDPRRCTWGKVAYTTQNLFSPKGSEAEHYEEITEDVAMSQANKLYDALKATGPNLDRPIALSAFGGSFTVAQDLWKTQV